MTVITLGIIGMGNMGSALYDGFVKSEASKGVTVLTFDKFKSSDVTVIELVQKSKYVMLAVKPQQLEEVLAEIAPYLTEETVLISICAGISAEYIRKRTSDTQKVICVMPNTPMMLGEGASAVSSDGLTGAEELEFACSVIGSCSPVVEVIPPDKMNEVICVNGSSPAFVYLFAKCFRDYAKEQGIEESAALRLFARTLTGASKMLTESGKTIEELIAQVSSKGGTTVAGLEALEQNGFCGAVKKACEACTKRAYELGGSR